MSLILSRREGLLIGAALLASRRALAQAVLGRRDWFSMIQQHHGLIARSFEELLARNDSSYEQRDLQMRTLDQVLKAHSLAEQTVIYPAMARAGMLGEAEKLYLEEAHFKIDKAQLELITRGRRGGRDWREPARALRDAVLRHARQDEEQRLFPELRRRLDAQQNQLLTELYPREFSTVVPRVTR